MGKNKIPTFPPQRGVVVWLTGLSGSGKSTIARTVAAALSEQAYQVELLDGDIVRQTFSQDLGYSRHDRDENVRRIAFVSSLLARHRVIVLVAAISPFQEARAEARSICGDFIEVYVNAPLHVCQERDVKGLYQRAREGRLTNLSGIDSPYDPPKKPDVICWTEQETIAQSASRVLERIERYLFLSGLTNISDSSQATPSKGAGSS